jgi:hypothetical protein
MASVSESKLTEFPNKNRETANNSWNEGLKGWTMVLLTMIFVALYLAALTGWLRPLSDVTMITRLEPIIFVIIGYYFGRLPAQQNERTYKDEINRNIKRADAGQCAKEQAERDRDVIEERLKNVKVALVSKGDQGGDRWSQIDSSSRNSSGSEKRPSIDYPTANIETAIRILSS